VPTEEAAAYFASRPRNSQLGAWASQQSEVIDGRAELDRRLAEIKARYLDTEVPLPPFWGGYVVEPDNIEFWQGRRSRLHDRLRYSRTAPGREWTVERLSP
jgi:pyridoxamine 5'-phosphate oxidase